MKKKMLTISLGTIVFMLSACNSPSTENLNNTEIVESKVVEESERNREEESETTENILVEESETVKIETNQILDYMREYSLGIINDEVKIYFWNVWGNTYGFRNFDEDCEYVGSNQEKYNLYFSADYAGDKEALTFGMLLSDMDGSDINASSLIFKNGIESIEFISAQFYAYGSLITLDILEISDNTVQDELEKWKEFFESDTITITVKKTTGGESVLELTNNTIQGVRGELDILEATMNAAF
jgi:hypothetical protein